MTFQELQCDIKKSPILNVLKSKKAQYLENQNLDRYWHTVRAYQGLKYLVVKKNIFVYDIQNVKVILATFEMKEHHKVYIEFWMNDEWSMKELECAFEEIINIIKVFTNQGMIVTFLCLPTNIFEYLLSKSDEHQLKPIFRNCCNTYLNNNRDGDNIPNLIEGFQLRKIPKENIDEVIKNWKHGRPEQRDWIKNSIENWPSMGVWDVETNEMVGQFIFLFTGTFGALTIKEAYRGKKLAEMLIKGFRECVKECKMEFLIEVEEENVASQNLFIKQNFVEVSHSHYLVYKSN